MKNSTRLDLISGRMVGLEKTEDETGVIGEGVEVRVRNGTR